MFFKICVHIHIYIYILISLKSFLTLCERSIIVIVKFYEIILVGFFKEFIFFKNISVLLKIGFFQTLYPDYGFLSLCCLLLAPFHISPHPSSPPLFCLIRKQQAPKE